MKLRGLIRHSRMAVPAFVETELPLMTVSQTDNPSPDIPSAEPQTGKGAIAEISAGEVVLDDAVDPRSFEASYNIDYLIAIAQAHFEAYPYKYTREPHYKLSEVIEQFVEPILEPEDSLETIASKILVAILAWNLSFLPKKQQKEDLEAFLEEFNESRPFAQLVRDQTLGILKKTIQNFIADRKRYFSQYKRLVIDYNLRPDGEDGFILQVASVPLPKSTYLH